MCNIFIKSHLNHVLYIIIHWFSELINNQLNTYGFFLKFYLLHCMYCLHVVTYYTINIERGHHVRDRMVVGFTTTCAISVYSHWCCEFELRSGEVNSYNIMW